MNINKEANKSDLKDMEKEEDKKIKKQLESFLEVAKVRLGRTPDLSELIDIMSQDGNRSLDETGDLSDGAKYNQEYGAEPDPGLGLQPNPALAKEDDDLLDDEPGLLGYKVYYGMNSEKQPDRAKILFYEAVGGDCYDCNNGEWTDARPSVLDHLPSRDIECNDHDLIHSIIHGIMTDDDFNVLDKSGIFSDNVKSLWQKIKRLQEISNNQNSSSDDDLYFDDDSLEDDDFEMERISKSYDNNEEGLQKTEEDDDFMELDLGFEDDESYNPDAINNLDEETKELASETIQYTEPSFFDGLMNAVAEKLSPSIESMVKQIVKEYIDQLLLETNNTESIDFNEN